MKTRKKSSGLVVWRGRMYWTWDSGSLHWAPKWVKDAVVTAWNLVACSVLGHRVLNQHEYPENIRPREPRIICASCCKLFTPEEFARYVGSKHGR